jgi:hypothetical protein
MYTNVYRMFGTVQETKIGSKIIPYTLGLVKVPVVKEIPERCWFLTNDFAVTESSAVAAENPCDWTQTQTQIRGLLPLTNNARVKANHATLSNADTAGIVINWLHTYFPLRGGN